VKGILRADDALRAINHCASGIIVSNHGARQLDTTPAIFSVLPEIVDAVAGAVEIYIIWRDPARDRCAQSDGLWRAGGVGRARDPLGGWRSVEKPGSSLFWRCCVRSSIWPWRFPAARR
jgi:FMN-dependent dehydrogenase